MSARIPISVKDPEYARKYDELRKHVPIEKGLDFTNDPFDEIGASGFSNTLEDDIPFCEEESCDLTTEIDKRIFCDFTRLEANRNSYSHVDGEEGEEIRFRTVNEVLFRIKQISKLGGRSLVVGEHNYLPYLLKKDFYNIIKFLRDRAFTVEIPTTLSNEQLTLHIIW